MNLTTLGVLVGCVFRIYDQALTMGGMIACTMVAGRAMAPLLGVAAILMRLQQMLAALKSLMGLMALPREDDRRHLAARVRFPEFRCERVSLTYPGQPLPSLSGISLAIRPGERVGVIGRTGSGKTTLLRVLARLHLPGEGLVLLDGIDLAQIDPRRVREVCSYLPQDPILFHGSVRENILLGRGSGERGDEVLVEAAGMSGIMEWVNRHPKGFELPVGERGVLLSGGQRQAVALARALLGKPDVLLFDEPGANFDLGAEKHLRETLAAYLRAEPRRTLVMATHKLSLLELVDRVILLDAGKVVADGPRDRVLAALRGGGAKGEAAPAGALP
jgi:ATP-binding cassette subfamily C protein LapB